MPDASEQRPGSDARRALILFAKDPARVPVKTRLRSALSAEATERLYRAFLLDLVERFGDSALRARLEFDLFLHLWPPESAAQPWVVLPGTRALPQGGGDLGARLHSALTYHLESGREAAIVIGCDHPTLPAARVEEAFTLLAGHDAVFGPARDGGYYLVGLRRPAALLFKEIPWSTDRVLTETRRRAGEAGVTTAELAVEGDVDTPDDLAELRALWRASRAVGGRSGTFGRHTARVLEEMERRAP